MNALNQLIVGAGLTSGGGKEAFPAFSVSKWHCEMFVDIDQKCSDVFPQIKSLVIRNADAAFPMGTYSLFRDKENDYVWANRITYNGLYTDDIIFEVEEKD